MDRRVTFTKVAQSFGIPKPEFTERYLDPGSRNIAYREFERVKEIEVHGYPSLFLLKNGKYLDLAEGFTKEEDIRNQLNAIL